MAKQPNNLVLRILRDIRSTQADHTKRFDQIGRRLDEVHDGMIAAFDLAGHAHVHHVGVQKEIDDLKKRVARLEKKL